MRGSDRFFIFMAVLITLFTLSFIHGTIDTEARTAVFDERVRLVRSLSLTDLCLFTEARYTRHPAMADIHSAFQDHPASLEHFPSGALISPPVHIGAPSWRVNGTP
jgi:hypothetical protein